jgi:hypothetical protein
MHNDADAFFTKRNNVSTAISLLFQSITEAGLLAIISNQFDVIYVRVTIAVLLAFSIFVSTYSMFKNYSKRASDHHAHAVSYKRICDRMTADMLKPEDKKAPEPGNLIDIAGDVTLLENYEPPIPGHIANKYEDVEEDTFDLESSHSSVRSSPADKRMENLVSLMEESK